MGVFSGSRQLPTFRWRRHACDNCVPSARGIILFSTREANKLSPDLMNLMETTFMVLKLLLVNASCSTRTCETPYVVYLMFIDTGPRYSSPTRQDRINHWNRTGERGKVRGETS
jgi:hypothetical protein